MDRYARVDRDTVVEIIELPEKSDISKLFHAEIAKHTYPAPENVTVGWGYSKGKFNPPEEIIAPEPVTVVNSIDLWSRMEDDEADRVGEAMASQSLRTRQIFQSAITYRSDHEMWPLLTSIAEELFGKTRAAEILAPSTGA